MLHTGQVIAIALGYMAVVFALAVYAEKVNPSWLKGRARPVIYALTLGVYCSAWTIFGSVGVAATQGYNFLPVYLGPILMIGLGYPLLMKIVRLAKSQNITSIADFVAARYGKSAPLAALVTVAALFGTLPYIALQLKAIVMALSVLSGEKFLPEFIPVMGDTALIVALFLALLSIFLGARNLGAAEHQNGLVLVVAFEALLKLFAFLILGVYVTWFVFSGPADLMDQAQASGILDTLYKMPTIDNWIGMTLVAGVCCILLPRQFHVAVVENKSEFDILSAAWLFPLYLVAISIFIIPVALAGILILPANIFPPDMLTLGVPLYTGNIPIAIMIFLGGFSAAVVMVIVECIALSIMISNDIVVPLLLRGERKQSENMAGHLLLIRRVSIVVILALAYCCFRLLSEKDLVAFGAIAMVAIAQFAPAFFGGLFWQRATAPGAISGLCAGLIVWGYIFVFPALVDTQTIFSITSGDNAGSFSWLNPHDLFGWGLSPLAQGIFCSLGVNILFYVLGSYIRLPDAMERLQANAFIGGELITMAPSFRLWRAPVTIREVMATVARYLGQERTREACEGHIRLQGGVLDREAEADVYFLRFAEHILASAIGAASSRRVISLLLRRRSVSNKEALRFLDDASAAIQYSRDLLQLALDHAKQGITVVDANRRIVCWNREFSLLFDIPSDALHVGIGLENIIRFNAERGLYGAGRPEHFVADRIERIVTRLDTFRTRLYPSNRVIEIRSNRMPDGGTVTTYSDVSETVDAEEALERANETLERRVKERTRELTRLNQELVRAKAEADEANISKTRFLAAASHDILQPLNAARIYSTSLVERLEVKGASQENELAGNIDASLSAVEEILSALLDISRLDSSVLRPDISNFHINDIFRQLEVEFFPVAQAKDLHLQFVSTQVVVRSDRRLLRRLIQNLVSNAIKYTSDGKVLVGCRREKEGRIRVEVWDTGQGIPEAKQKIIFKEFHRLDQGAKIARGLGLGLSIVERIARILGERIQLRSTPSKGSVFFFGLECGVMAPEGTRETPMMPVSSGMLKGLRILCIDNERNILEGMYSLLSNWGCDVMVAQNAEEAIALLSQAGNVPQVILADYHLDNNCTGLEAIAAIRDYFKYPVAALLLTADRSLEVQSMAEEVDVSIHNKPLKPAALRAVLAQLRNTIVTSG